MANHVLLKVHDKHAKTTGVVRRKVNESNPGEIGATLSGSVVKILVKKGQSVTKGEPINRNRSYEDGNNNYSSYRWYR